MSYQRSPHRSLTILSLVLAAGIMSASALAAPAIDGVVDASYGAPLATDPKGDYVGDPQWDLNKLWVTHDATYIYIAFSIGGDLTANPGDEKNFLFYVDTTNDSSGATSDAWERKITVQAPHRPEYSINTWYKTGSYGLPNVELRSWSGAAWATAPKSITAAALKVAGGETIIEWQVARADLGNPQQVFVEVISTGSFKSDNAQDTINDPADDWNAPTGTTQWTAPASVKCSTQYTIVLPPDAGVPDQGTPDQGIPDQSTPDVGAPDQGVPDQGKPDMGVDQSQVQPDLGAEKDEGVEKDKGTVEKDQGSGGPDRGIYSDMGGSPPRADEEGCGCAAKGDMVAANALPLILAFGVIGFRRRDP